MGDVFHIIAKLITNPRIVLDRFVIATCSGWMSDKWYLSLRYRIRFGKKLNLTNPQSFNEKLQWIKLYDHRPDYSTMVDKYAVKKYVSEVIGEQYIIQSLGVWDNVEDIEWEKLPNRFVLKCTHDSSSIVICKDKSQLDIQSAKKRLRKCLNRDYFKVEREWPYKNVPRRIIAEQFIEPAPGITDLADYKWFCFNGEVKMLYVATERNKPGESAKFDFFDVEGRHIPVQQEGHPNATIPPKFPKNSKKMIELAGMLSKDIPFIRVDFYEIGDSVLFGELTFFPMGGFSPLVPEEWDLRFGEMLRLPLTTN